MSETPIPQLIAHRGYLQRYPENTWRALEAAIQVGAAWLEFDIQMCRDGQFVLLHDDNFKRTSGVEQSVFEVDSHQIDISVHEPDRFGRQFEPTLVLTLVDLLQKICAYPNVHVMVEIKSESINYWGLDNVLRKLAPLLARHQQQCVLISFDRAALQWCRERYRDIRIGWVLDRYSVNNHEHASELEPDFLIIDVDETPSVQTLWPGPWQWMLYDIIDPDLAIKWAACGVDLIETANIGSMLQDPRLKPRGS